MKFVEPSWLWIGAGACAVLIALLLWQSRRRARALARFVAVRHVAALSASVSPGRRFLKHVLLVSGVALVFAALARPQWGHHLEVQRSEGVELMFAIDTSKSMLAEDLKPSRLARARLAVEDLLEQMPNNPAGLVVFAGDAFLQTPMTLDRPALRRSLEALDTELIPVPGTDLRSAVRVAEQAFGGGAADRRKVLVLLTDGEDLEGSALTAARQAADSGITIFTLGVGTEQGGPVPVRDARGQVSLLRGPDGELVHSRLDETTLREMASLTGGAYRALGSSGEGLEALYSEYLARLPAESVEGRSIPVFHERFQWPLGLGLALLLLEWWMRDHRRRRAARRTPLAAAAAALGLLIVPFARVHASDGEPVRTYNRATADYRAGDFEAAAENYRAALDTRDLTLQQRAYYDLGNALYRQGQAAQDAATTKARFESAIEAYDSALALDAGDADAKYNRDFVRAKLEALEREQAQQQDDESSDGQQGGEPQDQQDSGGGGQQPQSGSGSNADHSQGHEDSGGGGQQPQSGSESKPGDAQDGPSGDGAQQGQGDARNQNGSDPSDPPEQDARDAQGGGASASPDDKGQDARGSQQSGDSGSSPHPAADGDARGREGQSESAGRERPEQRDGSAKDGTASAASPEGSDERSAGSPASGEEGSQAQSEPDAADRAAGSGAGGAAQARSTGTGEPAVPGGLTRDQSIRLLDALEGELRQLPSGVGGSEAAHANDEHSRKDW